MTEKKRDVLILDEAGSVNPETWMWLKKAIADGRVKQSVVDLSPEEAANNPRESWRYVILQKARGEVEDLRWHLEGQP